MEVGATGWASRTSMYRIAPGQAGAPLTPVRGNTSSRGCARLGLTLLFIVTARYPVRLRFAQPIMPVILVL